MTVYLVMYWNYDDSSPSGVFSTREKAQAFIDDQPLSRSGQRYEAIEEFILDGTGGVQ